MSKKKRMFPLKQAIEYARNGLNYNQIAKLIKYNSITVSKQLRKLDPEMLKEPESEVKKGLEPIPEVELAPISDKPQPEKKPPTKPWLQTENPWVPDMTGLKTKHKGFVPRWTDPDRVEQREGEGMRIAKAEDWGEKSKSGDAGVYKRRGMILMEMPEEVAESKRAYLKHKTDMQDPEVLQKVMVEKGRQISKQAHIDMGLRIED